MKTEDFKKDYWVWYWGTDDDVEGYQIFFDHAEMKEYSAQHSKLNNHRNGYWSDYDKVKKRNI